MKCRKSRSCIQNDVWPTFLRQDTENHRKNHGKYCQNSRQLEKTKNGW